MIMDAQLPERRERLWLVIVSPVIWASHFLLSYVTASVWCAKAAGPEASLWPVRVAIAIYTLAALIGIAWNGWRGYRRHVFGTSTSTHDFDSPAGRHGFLGFAVAILSMLSAIATIYGTFPIVFIGSCR
jgi:hypothetical protein